MVNGLSAGVRSYLHRRPIFPTDPWLLFGNSGCAAQGCPERDCRLRSSVSVPCWSNSIARANSDPDPADASLGLDDRRARPLDSRGERINGKTGRSPFSVPTTTRASRVRICIPSSLARTRARMTMSPCCGSLSRLRRSRKVRVGDRWPSLAPGGGGSGRPDPDTRTYLGGVRREDAPEE